MKWKQRIDAWTGDRERVGWRKGGREPCLKSATNNWFQKSYNQKQKLFGIDDIDMAAILKSTQAPWEGREFGSTFNTFLYRIFSLKQHMNRESILKGSQLTSFGCRSQNRSIFGFNENGCCIYFWWQVWVPAPWRRARNISTIWSDIASALTMEGLKMMPH